MCSTLLRDEQFRFVLRLWVTLQIINCLNVSMQQSPVMYVKRTSNLVAETCVSGYAGKNWEKEGDISLLSAKETGHASHLLKTRLASPSLSPGIVCRSAPWQVASESANCSLAQHVQNASCLMSCLCGSPFGAILSEATATDVFRKGKSLHFIRFSSTFSQDHMVYIDVLYTSYLADY